MSQSPNSVAAIIAAGGSGERFGAKVPKALIQLVGITLIERAVTALSPVVDEIIIVAPAGFEKNFQDIFGESVQIVTGGPTRSASVKAGLASVSPEVGYLLVHDAARALATSELAQSVLDELKKGESAVIPAIAVVDTIKEVGRDGYVRSTPERSSLRAVQTPQGFERSVLERAHQASEDATDDGALVEGIGIKVKLIVGEERALKITTKEDLELAAQYLIGATSLKNMRTGIGVDAHAFSTDSSRPMWLAGLLWPDVIGVDAHSDGDVGVHALCDALLSAAELGDLGSNFGISNPEYAGASGEKLLQETCRLISSAGYSIANVSLQIIGNKPKIGPRRREVIATLRQILGGAPVSVSATTTDGLGFTGEGKGISAIASALIYHADK